MAHPARRPLSESPRYREFVQERDKALEILHLKTQMRITDILGGALQRVVEIVSYWYTQSHGSMHALHQIDNLITQPFKEAHPLLLKAIEDMRKRAYVLSHAGEVEAIGRATGRPHHVNIQNVHTQMLKHKMSPAGGELSHRIELYLNRIKRKIEDAIKVSAITYDFDKDEDPLGDCMIRVRRAMPKVKYYSRPNRILKPLKERSINIGTQKNPATMSVGFVDDSDWNEMVDDYKNDYIFTNRGPDGVLDSDAKIPQYEWELEQDVTQDFVDRVRDGQIDAANENGINDFVWIAIIDDRTDECCVWRNGLTSSEISLALQNEHAEDECVATTPSAHFNCRCTMAPMTEEMPDTPPSRIGEFEDWLNQTNS